VANLKTLKSRIKSVKSTQKITKAMKMVAASRLKKAKNLVESSRPYSENLNKLISNLAGDISFKDNLNERFPILTGNGSEQTYLLVVLSSDRGLCGGLNSGVVRYTKKRVNDLVSQGKSVKIICIGKKAYEQIKSVYGKKIIYHKFGIFKNQIDFKIAQEIAGDIVNRFEEKEFDICEVIFSKFKSAISQEPQSQQIIPASENIDKENSKTDKELVRDFAMPIVYEPNKEVILDSLLPKNIAIQIYNKLLENSASEQGARMAAMESATNNASKMIKNLTLVYNRTRQANITRELIDIISGANAV